MVGFASKTSIIMSNSSEAKMINTIKEEKGEMKSSGAGKGMKGKKYSQGSKRIRQCAIN